MALQLAGLQAQVVLGAYEEGKEQRYREVEQYLCKRILNAPGRDWSEEVASAHKVIYWGPIERGIVKIFVVNMTFNSSSQVKNVYFMSDKHK